MGKRGKHHRTKRTSRLKTPLWLGALLLLAGCAVWAGLHALPVSAPEPPQSTPLPLEAAQQITPPSLPVSATPQPEATHQPEPPRVPVLEDVGGCPVMARLAIEEIGLELPVIAELSDEALKTAPCLYAGPSIPEDAGNIVIVGHNYRNDSHFGRLDELGTGAAVRLTDRYGEVYDYEIYDIQTIAPDETYALEDYEGEHGLALITCTTSGKNRLLVKCRMTSEFG